MLGRGHHIVRVGWRSHTRSRSQAMRGWMAADLTLCLKSPQIVPLPHMDSGPLAPTTLPTPGAPRSL